MSQKKNKNKTPSGPQRDWSALDRRMIADDASWIQSFALSSTQDEDWKAIMGLTILPHCARIVHESYSYLTGQNRGGALSVQLRFGAEIAAARHTVKLLDDNKKLYDGVVEDFERIAKVHRASFRSWNNFEVASRDGRVFATSRVSDFQGAFAHSELTAGNRKDDSHAYKVGYDMGQALPGIVSVLSIPWPLPVAVPLPSGQPPHTRTRSADSYYETRFEPEFPDALKDILTVIESSVNTALIVFDPSADTFVGPVFRARLVSTVHALKALTEITQRHPELAGRAGMTAVQQVLDTTAAGHLISDDLRHLRNRCMHYRIPSNLANLGAKKPVYGLVEATTDSTYDTVNNQILDTLAALSAALKTWTT